MTVTPSARNWRTTSNSRSLSRRDRFGGTASTTIQSYQTAVVSGFEEKAFAAYFTAQTHDIRATLWTPSSLILIFISCRTCSPRWATEGIAKLHLLGPNSTFRRRMSVVPCNQMCGVRRSEPFDIGWGNVSYGRRKAGLDRTAGTGRIVLKNPVFRSARSVSCGCQRGKAAPLRLM